jgi:hypothetical protein
MARLREAIAAHRGALAVFVATQSTYYWKLAQNNLDEVKSTLIRWPRIVATP